MKGQLKAAPLPISDHKASILELPGIEEVTLLSLNIPEHAKQPDGPGGGSLIYMDHRQESH